MSHCIPPRQGCANCRAHVRAAQMTEREWRRALWFHEVGSPAAGWAALGAAGALVGRVTYLLHTGAALLPWAFRLGTLATIAAVALMLCYLWRRAEWACNEAVGPHWGEEVDSYRAAKVAREWHDEIVWEANVEILKAHEAARSEVAQLKDRIETRVRQMEGR